MRWGTVAAIVAGGVDNGINVLVFKRLGEWHAVYVVADGLIQHAGNAPGVRGAALQDDELVAGI